MSVGCVRRTAPPAPCRRVLQAHSVAHAFSPRRHPCPSAPCRPPRPSPSRSRPSPPRAPSAACPPPAPRPRPAPSAQTCAPSPGPLRSKQRDAPGKRIECQHHRRRQLNVLQPQHTRGARGGAGQRRHAANPSRKRTRGPHVPKVVEIREHVLLLPKKNEIRRGRPTNRIRSRSEQFFSPATHTLVSSYATEQLTRSGYTSRGGLLTRRRLLLPRQPCQLPRAPQNVVDEIFRDLRNALPELVRGLDRLRLGLESGGPRRGSARATGGAYVFFSVRRRGRDSWHAPGCTGARGRELACNNPAARVRALCRFMGYDAFV